MTGDERGLAVQAVALSVLLGRVRARLDDVKAQLAGGLTPGDRKTAALDSGVKVGSVTFTAGKRTARVVDEAAFTAWVAERMPDEIVTKVRDKTRDKLLDHAKKVNAPVQAETGEVIPGIEIVTGSPYLSVRPDEASLPALVDAIRASQDLALDGTIEVEQ